MVRREDEIADVVLLFSGCAVLGFSTMILNVGLGFSSGSTKSISTAVSRTDGEETGGGEERTLFGGDGSVLAALSCCTF